MRLQEIINENLEWGNGLDKDIYMSLKGLVNNNDGIYKSQKQRWFIENRLIGGEQFKSSRQTNREWFGVDTGDGEKLVNVDAMARWAEYGARSQVPVRYGFVMDTYGVVKFYRIGNKGNMRDGAQPDPSKTKLEWERPAKVDTKHLEKTEDEKKAEFDAAIGITKGDYVGTEGERMNFGELELVAKKEQGYSNFGYNQAVEKFWNMYQDVEGNIIYHTGKQGPAKGEKIQVTATVKTHLVNKKGQKVTVIIRPRFKTVESVNEGFLPSLHDEALEQILMNIEVAGSVAKYTTHVFVHKSEAIPSIVHTLRRFIEENPDQELVPMLEQVIEQLEF